MGWDLFQSKDIHSALSLFFSYRSISSYFFSNHTYLNNDEIRAGELITVDFGYEYCIVLRLFINEEDLVSWGWDIEPGAGVFLSIYPSI